MNHNQILETFKSTLAEEANAIIDTIDLFGDEVVSAVELINKISGKLVVTGVGKSGHIGEKMAATLSSTGTPSFFMHSTEAMHGDLGMIESNDIVLCISNSGETQEVLNIIPALKKRNIPLIALTRSHQSTLAKLCDVSLAYNYKEECDELHLAPTTSSTLTLAIGDALAVTLSIMKEFSATDFYTFHPGGSLGKLLSKKE
ncbi:MAG: SIS domain-containing protein [Candidatus Izemoplasmatales bacterium]|nr:SIS domain-containing protein [Candidatus Izemoplasmatales bacterium]